MAQFKLYYFNGRGRAELARLIFAASGQQYEDVRFQGEEWPANKPNAPFGQVPYLEVHDGSNVFKLAQSLAIARYLAKKLNLAGQTDQEIAEADMYAELVNDLLSEMIKVHFEKDEKTKAELTSRLTTEIVPKNLSLFEARLAKQTSGYLVGSGLTWVDLHLVNVLEWLGDKREALYEQFSHVKKHDSLVRSLPNIAAWLAKRPQTPF